MIPLNLWGFAGIALAAFATGYQVSDWRRDSAELSEVREARKVFDKALDRESKVAEAVEARLATLRANERVIEKTRLQIVDRPIYNIDCLDSAGQDLLREYAEGAK